MLEDSISSNHERPHLDDWGAESLRLTSFPAPDAPLLDPGAWESLVGEPPERLQQSPRLQSFQATGPWNPGDLPPTALALHATADRIDWRVTPIPSPEEAYPNVGRAGVAVDAFTGLMARWLTHAPALKRLALGVVLQLPVQSLEEGQRVLALLLPYELDLDGVTDFLLQLNRRRDSRAMDIEVNRLSKWSLITTAVIRLEFSGVQATSLPSVQHHAIQLELDINTAPIEGSLPHNVLPALLQEFASIGKEVAEEGLAR